MQKQVSIIEFIWAQSQIFILFCKRTLSDRLDDFGLPAYVYATFYAHV